MQHGTCSLHNYQYRDGGVEPEPEDENHHEDANDTCEAETDGQCHIPKDNRKLSVRQRESPQTEVGGGVRDAIEAKFCG